MSCSVPAYHINIYTISPRLSLIQQSCDIYMYPASLKGKSHHGCRTLKLNPQKSSWSWINTCGYLSFFVLWILQRQTLTFHSFSFIICASEALLGAGTLVEFRAEWRAGLTVVCQGPWTAATGRVALTTAALLHVLVITHGTTGFTHAIQHQVEETAFWNDTVDLMPYCTPIHSSVRNSFPSQYQQSW